MVRIHIRFRGAMVARLTPDQEVACSNHVEITGNRYGKMKKSFLLLSITIADLETLSYKRRIPFLTGNTS